MILRCKKNQVEDNSDSIKESYDNEYYIETNKTKRLYDVFKRFLDIIVSLTAIILLSPLFLIVCLAIKINSKGPMLFAQERMGFQGKSFYLYKFRSMVINAEQLIEKLPPDQKKEYMENFKLENDPRITSIGKFIRKTSIDELPQLFNILKGDISCVGPRPVVKKEIEKYGDQKDKLLSIKPGLTGYWQSHRKVSTTYEERIQMELFYVDNYSMWLDIKVILKTFLVLIKGQCVEQY